MLNSIRDTKQLHVLIRKRDNNKHELALKLHRG